MSDYFGPQICRLGVEEKDCKVELEKNLTMCYRDCRGVLFVKKIMKQQVLLPSNLFYSFHAVIYKDVVFVKLDYCLEMVLLYLKSGERC